MKRLVFAAMAASCLLMTTGCTGSFNLTKNLWSWHRSFESQWTDETLFLVLAVAQVYSVAVLADTLIFNLIEFWDGSNPVREASLTADDGTQVAMFHNADGSVSVNTDKGVFTMQRTDDGVVATDASGSVLYTSKTVEQHVEVKDADGTVTAFEL